MQHEDIHVSRCEGSQNAAGAPLNSAASEFKGRKWTALPVCLPPRRARTG
jgi:hypothetical protein